MNKIMLEYSEHMKTIHIPRWNELPDVDLYKDQVVELVERYVRPLSTDEDKIITPSMINNYVKWKLVPPPNRKKQYSRTHLAYFIVVTTFKTLFSLNQIEKGISQQIVVKGPEKAYDDFCERIELCLKSVASSVSSNAKLELPLIDTEAHELYLSIAAMAKASQLMVIKRMELRKE